MLIPLMKMRSLLYKYHMERPAKIELFEKNT